MKRSQPFKVSNMSNHVEDRSKQGATTIENSDFITQTTMTTENQQQPQYRIAQVTLMLGPGIQNSGTQTISDSFESDFSDVIESSDDSEAELTELEASQCLKNTFKPIQNGLNLEQTKNWVDLQQDSQTSHKVNGFQKVQNNDPKDIGKKFKDSQRYSKIVKILKDSNVNKLKL